MSKLSSLYWRGISRYIGEYRNYLLLFNWDKHVALEVLVWLFLIPALLLLRWTILFIFTHLVCSHGLWLFLNRLMDGGFLAIFLSLFE